VEHSELFHVEQLRIVFAQGALVVRFGRTRAAKVPIARLRSGGVRRVSVSR
jgi:hypothetical protein